MGSTRTAQGFRLLARLKKLRRVDPGVDTPPGLVGADRRGVDSAGERGVSVEVEDPPTERRGERLGDERAEKRLERRSDIPNRSSAEFQCSLAFRRML
eukprot:scaffold176966_cov26-Tisochrysis_lutea.AAC.2